MKAYKVLVKNAIKAGFKVSVFDGEEWDVIKSSKQKDIYASIEGVEEAQLVFFNDEGKKVGWALVSAFGLEDDETVIDNTVSIEYLCAV